MLPDSTSIPRSSSPPMVRLGFIQLSDAAPLIVAAEAGLFAAVGLELQLSRELGWASIYDRLRLGQLDYIHALGPMPLAASLGLNCLAMDCVGLMPLSYNGNAITLTRKLWDDGIRTAEEFAGFVRQEKWRRRFILGVVSPTSSHQFLLREWLHRLDLRPDRDVEIVNIPPGQFLRNLQAHTIDGACVGEPWGSFAVQQGIGWCPSHSMKIAPGHLEKTVMTTRERLKRDPDTAARLVAAIRVAADWCQDPEKVADVAQLLSRSPYLQTPARIIEGSLRTDQPAATGAPAAGLTFGKPGAPEFVEADLRWIEEGLRKSGLLEHSVPGGRYALTRYYPSAVVRNAQQFIEQATNHAFGRFFSER